MVQDDRDKEESAEVGGRGEPAGRLYWRSRRGMLELELILVPFVQQRYPDLSNDLKRAYAELLDCEDWLIYDWLQGRATPERPEMRRLIDTIIDGA